MRIINVIIETYWEDVYVDLKRYSWIRDSRESASRVAQSEGMLDGSDRRRPDRTISLWGKE